MGQTYKKKIKIVCDPQHKTIKIQFTPTDNPHYCGFSVCCVYDLLYLPSHCHYIFIKLKINSHKNQ